MTVHAGRISVIDSHTGGEPTRVLLAGFPVLIGDTVAAKRADLSARFHAACDDLVGEPRGSEPMVGALLVEPADTTCAAGVIFFDRSGPIGMCGHGMIGLIVTLQHLGRITAGRHRVDTAVGVVEADLDTTGAVTIANVPSRRLAEGVELQIAEIGTVTGDVAFGGNTFFLVTSPGLRPDADRARNSCASPASCNRPLTMPDTPMSITSNCSANRPSPEPTRAASSGARRAPTTDPRAAPAPAPSSPAWPPTAPWPKVRPGCRNRSPARCSLRPTAGSTGRAARSLRGSRAGPRCCRKPPSSSTPPGSPTPTPLVERRRGRQAAPAVPRARFASRADRRSSPARSIAAGQSSQAISWLSPSGGEGSASPPSTR